MDLNSQDTLELHNKLIKEKKFLNLVYKTFYQKLLKIDFPRGEIIELGSGGGFIKEINPNIITSDIISGLEIDKVFSANKIPFPNNSISGFIMLNVFHHIKNPVKALVEMERVLKKGGKIVMIEPFNSLWGRFIYKNFHHEAFNPSSSWKVKGRGRLTDANGAITWIIFVRDSAIFKKRFPKLQVLSVEPHTPFLYLLSGGLSDFQLIPSFFFTAIKTIEEIISPLNFHLGMFVTIELKKI